MNNPQLPPLKYWSLEFGVTPIKNNRCNYSKLTVILQLQNNSKTTPTPKDNPTLQYAGCQYAIDSLRNVQSNLY